jgi:hypothetical protein
MANQRLQAQMLLLVALTAVAAVVRVLHMAVVAAALVQSALSGG